MRDKFQKIENHWLWIWIKRNAVPIGLIGAFLGFITIYFLIPIFNKQKPEAFSNKKPNVKITSVSYRGQIYTDSPTTQSEALNFLITMRNEGDTDAYDVQIKKKILGLPRGTYDLKEPSLQTLLTGTRFDLPERKIATDSIFIDETPASMQRVRNGEIPITIEYEITYYGDKYKRIGLFVYKYKNSTTNGIFEEDTAEESINLKP